MQNRIKELRLEKGMSAAKLADMVGTSQQQIDRLEKSQRRLDTDWIRRLTEALDCAPSDIVPEFKTENKIDDLNALLDSVKQSYQDDRRFQPILQLLEDALDAEEKKENK